MFTENLDVTSYENGKRETHNPVGRAFAPVVWDYYQVRYGSFLLCTLFRYRCLMYCLILSSQVNQVGNCPVITVSSILLSEWLFG